MTCSATSRSTSSPRRSRKYRTLSLSYVDLSSRFQFALQGFSQTQFFYGQLGGVFYDPAYSGLVSPRSRDRDPHGPRRQHLRNLPIQPLPSRRADGRRDAVERGRYNDPSLQGGRAAVSTADLRPGSVQQRHPRAARRRVRSGDDGVSASSARCRATRCGLGYTISPKIGADAIAPDRRRGLAALPAARRLGPAGDPACAGSRAAATTPTSCTSAATRELRGYDYLQFAGQNTVFANAELRFPLIEAALTPIGVIGGIRGVFFAGVGGAWFRQPALGRSLHVVRVQVRDEQRRNLHAGDRGTRRMRLGTPWPTRTACRSPSTARRWWSTASA